MVSRSRWSGFSANSSSVPQRSRAKANATSVPAVTSSDSIANEAPLACHAKNGGQVSA